MKKVSLIFVLLVSWVLNSQDLSYLFDGKTFELSHFLKDGVREELDLEHPNGPSGNSSLHIPYLEYTFNTTSNQLESNISGYCNGTNAKYIINQSNLEVIERGGTTLQDCPGYEEEEVFTPVTGNIYLQQPAKLVNFEFSDDQK